MSYPEPRYHDDSGLTTAIETRTRRPTAEAASRRGRAARAGSRDAAAAGVSRALATNRPLAFLGLSMLATLAAALVGLVADPRVITGAPAWLKPAKFAISTAIYAFTLLWLLTFIEGRRWPVRLASVAIAAALFVEVALIVLQAARGTTSHFNVGTSLDEAIWGAMAALIVVVWLATLLVAVLLLRQRLPDPAFVWGLRLGLLISLLGMAIAAPMTFATADQIAEERASGQRLTVAGAHTIGAPDGGPGLPVVGWSTEAGDLRVAHFVGLHGLQVMPLAAWLVGRRRRLGPGHRVALVWTGAGLYGGLVLVLTWQALRGQPSWHPTRRPWPRWPSCSPRRRLRPGPSCCTEAADGSETKDRSNYHDRHEEPRGCGPRPRYRRRPSTHAPVARTAALD